MLDVSPALADEPRFLSFHQVLQGADRFEAKKVTFPETFFRSLR